MSTAWSQRYPFTKLPAWDACFGPWVRGGNTEQRQELCWTMLSEREGREAQKIYYGSGYWSKVFDDTDPDSRGMGALAR